MDFAPIVEFLEIDDLVNLFFVNSIWRNWIKQNLSFISILYKLPPAKSFEEMYALSWCSPGQILQEAKGGNNHLLQKHALARHAVHMQVEPDWLVEEGYAFLQFEPHHGILVTPEKTYFTLESLNKQPLYNFEKNGFYLGKASLYNRSEAKIITLDENSFPGSAYKKGIQTYKQYLFLAKRLDRVCGRYLHLSLPYVTSVRLFEFFKNKLQNQIELEEAIFDCLHNCIEQHNYELAMHLVEKYPSPKIIYYEQHFREFCFAIGFSLLDRRTEANHDHVRTVLDVAAPCTESLAVKTLNSLYGDVVNAVMKLTNN